MKNKKKSLNPNKFWYYNGYLPKINALNWNYQANYKKMNQITVFMENLMTRNFNLLLKRVKKFIFKMRKYYYIFLFNSVYFIFIKLLIYKYFNKVELIKYLFFYLRFFKTVILFNQMKKQSTKAIISKWRKKKRIKEHYLRAIPRYFKTFFKIKHLNYSLLNSEYLYIYCYSELFYNNFYLKKKKIKFFNFIDIKQDAVNNKQIKKFNITNFSIKTLILNKKFFLLCQQSINLGKWNLLIYFLNQWIKKKIALLFMFVLKKLKKKQIYSIFFFYLRNYYYLLIQQNKQKWSIGQQMLKKKYKNYQEYSLTLRTILQQRIKQKQLQFWRSYNRNKKKTYRQLLYICKMLLLKKKTIAKKLITSYFFFRILLKTVTSWFIYGRELLKIFNLQKYLNYCMTFVYIMRLKRKKTHLLLSKTNVLPYLLNQKLKALIIDQNPISFFKPSFQSIFIRQQQSRIFQFIYIQKYLENFFVKFLQIPISIRFVNQFFLSNRIKSYRLNFQKKKYFSKKKKIFLHSLHPLLQAFYLNDPVLIGKQIAYCLQQTGRRQKHSKTIKEIFYLLKLMKIVGFDLSGFQLLICGKFNANTQTQVKYFKWGPNLRTNTFSYPLQYYKTSIVTYTGVFGIHLWFIKNSYF